MRRLLKIEFEPRKRSYGQILQIFFSVALDPTELNRQGPDDGTQYRSEIFYNDTTQRKIAQSYIAQLDRAQILAASIVTRVEPNYGFFLPKITTRIISSTTPKACILCSMIYPRLQI
jgi:peptide-methionine (S)-S-oxide reductase